MDELSTVQQSIRFGRFILISLSLIGCSQYPLQPDKTPTPPPTPAVNPVENKATAGEMIISNSTATSNPYFVTVPSGLWERLSGKFGVTPGQYSLDVEEKDLWARMRSEFALPDRYHPKVLKEAQEYADYQYYLDTVIERAEPYLYYVMEEIEKRDMPAEIALMPIIESAYQPGAHSQVGAAGLWQFISSTGKTYGLKQSRWYDGRRDVAASTGAALNYLQKLNIDFDGDWLLTLAAYNCGEGTVLRALKKNRQAGKPIDFWSLDLPAETENYVPRLLAVSAIVADPEVYGVTLSFIPDEPYLASVDLDKQIDLKVIAQITGIPHEKIALLNPGFIRGATGPQGPHHLLLPVDKAADFTEKLALLNLDDLMPKNARRPKKAKQRTGTLSTSPKSPITMAVFPKSYTVRAGDSLSGIARRFKVTVAQLREWNAEQLKGKYLQPGYNLKLYLDRVLTDIGQY